MRTNCIMFYYFVNTQAVEKVLAGAIRREMALEEFCAKQAYEIKQLNRLVGFHFGQQQCSLLFSYCRNDFLVIVYRFNNTSMRGNAIP